MVKIQICPISIQKCLAWSITSTICPVRISCPEFQVQSFVSLLFVLLEQLLEEVVEVY